MLYCLSTDQKTDWTRKWSAQSEIREYMEDCTHRNDLLSHVRFGVRVTGATFDEASGTWTVHTAGGEEIVADVVVSAVGQLHRPRTPAIPGLETFRGARFHSARWDHAVDLAGKRVGTIGNAASAIQFIPQIAPTIGPSKNGISTRGRSGAPRPVAEARCILANVPGVAALYRGWLWLRGELFLYPVMRRHPWSSAR
jgi:cation diffusion facilitator CzcD-associated flavoprotein CzcO